MAFRSGSKKLSQRVSARTLHLRTTRGWSQQVFAEKLAEVGFPVNPNNVPRLERGERTISIDEAAAIAAVFTISLEELVTSTCRTCDGAPPAGFQCRSCGAEAGA